MIENDVVVLTDQFFSTKPLFGTKCHKNSIDNCALLAFCINLGPTTKTNGQLHGTAFFIDSRSFCSRPQKKIASIFVLFLASS
uniref:Transposase n=1 Tax=Bursaphelenchus xylophilus TaxID=6326 RepID=A0A1I7RNA4_BURXY